ncbi:MAG: endonuclease V [Thermoleophilia bacterium]|nr:endonuclease V [Thermoleophilia bacterium]
MKENPDSINCLPRADARVCVLACGSAGSDPRTREPLANSFARVSHPWRVSFEEAASIQKKLALCVVIQPFCPPEEGIGKLAAGLDAAYSRNGDSVWAAAVVMDRHFRVVEASVVAGEPDLPYVSGFLAFREGRVLLEALGRLTVRPDVVFVDGHGVVHERGLGLASHIGLLSGLPTIGAPKTPFHAIYRDPPRERGSYYVLTKEWGAEGAALCLRTGVKPIYVSPGHLVDLESAIRLCLAWSTGRRRVPEPLAAAHTLSVKARSGELDGAVALQDNCG